MPEINFVSYDAFCRFMAGLGYGAPDVDVEDQFLQFRLEDPDSEQNDLPPVVTIDFPKDRQGVAVGWPYELLWDFITTTLSTGRPCSGTRLRAQLAAAAQH